MLRELNGMRLVRVRLSLSVAAVLPLVACGGGGGVSSTPPPVAAPTPTPVPTPTPPVTPNPTPAPTTPTPTPTLPTNFATPEYNRSTGLVQASAITAYQRGFTGAGITVGVIDSGIDVDSPEFAGRISGASADLVSNRGLQDEGGHGTAVSSVVLGAKNDSGTHGVAFNATLLVLRTDTVGSCLTTGDEGGCKHSDSAIARGIDLAVASGARVINISLGGAGLSNGFRNAVARAAAAGLVIVISAGNDGTAEPDALALVANEAGARGQVVIAGSVDQSATISSFSNRAGSGAANYMVALGERVRAPDEEGTAFLYSGTSFSAPHVAGALALLAQAFPNLSGRQLVQLLYASARDLGAAGVDPVYGNGLLDLSRAFQPIGGLSLPGTTAAVSMTDNGAMSGPMGDARGAGGAMGAVLLDGFDRAFAVDLAGTIAAARPRAALGGALGLGWRSLSAGAGETVVAVQIRDDGRAGLVDPLTLRPAEAAQARATAGFVASRIGRDLGLALGFGHGAATLVDRLAPGQGPAFLVARDGSRELGFDRTTGGAAALRLELGRAALWTSAETGEAIDWREAGRDLLPGRPQRYALVSAGLDRQVGAATLGVSLGWLDERETVLGARFGPLFGAPGARSWFADAELGAPIGRWRAGLGMRMGRTRVAAGGARPGAATLATDAFRADLSTTSLWRPGDRFGLRLSQPLRIRDGTFALTLAEGYDYEAGVTATRLTRFDLAPRGREVNAELAYGLPLLGGWADANLFWRRDPGNIAALPDDRGGAVRFSLGF